MSDFFHFTWLFLTGLLLIWLTEWLYNTKKIHVEITRKIVHIGAGLLALFLPVYFQNQWWVLLLCGLVQLILVLSFNMGYLKSINSIKRKSYGSLVYPMVVFLVYMAWYYSGSTQNGTVQSYAYFYLPILIMALCHPLATLATVYYPIFKFKKLNKSVGSLLTFWTIAFLLSCVILLFSNLFNTKDITWVAIFIATMACITEYYSEKGLSTLFIPIVVLLSMYVVEYFF